MNLSHDLPLRQQPQNLLVHPAAGDDRQARAGEFLVFVKPFAARHRAAFAAARQDPIDLRHGRQPRDRATGIGQLIECAVERHPDRGGHDVDHVVDLRLPVAGEADDDAVDAEVGKARGGVGEGGPLTRMRGVAIVLANHDAKRQRDLGGDIPHQVMRRRQAAGFQVANDLETIGAATRRLARVATHSGR